MTELGLAHYGGTLGLYMQPRAEWVRALAHYNQTMKRLREHEQGVEAERARRRKARRARGR